jgi:hypothetical protein
VINQIIYSVAKKHMKKGKQNICRNKKKMILVG